MENTDIEIEVKVAMGHTMLALFNVGYTELHLGGLMRIMGIPAKQAEKFDNTIVELDANLQSYVNEITTKAEAMLGVPKDATLH